MGQQCGSEPIKIMLNMDQNFILDFLKKHKRLIRTMGQKYLIPNRYSLDDIIGYITEKIIGTLKKRQGSDNRIMDKEKYFRRCLEFYCIEYQRQHGYIFDLPKRPRKNAREDEEDIKKKGFKYLGDMLADEEKSLVHNDAIGEELDHSQFSAAWHSLTGILKPEDAEVIDCIFARGMTWPETARHLNVAQSTCWSRKNRAMKTIFNYFDKLSGEMRVNIKLFLRGHDGVIEEFTDEVG